jgi:hypothetical protein
MITQSRLCVKKNKHNIKQSKVVAQLQAPSRPEGA